jgi:nitrogen fixation NifU-like protein
MVIYLLVTDGCIKEAGFKTFGCPAAIAAGSVLTEMLKDHRLDEARQIESAHVLKRLGGLPLGKRHCANIAVSALTKAIEEVKPPSSGSEGASRDSATTASPKEQTGTEEAL